MIYLHKKIETRQYWRAASLTKYIVWVPIDRRLFLLLPHVLDFRVIEKALDYLAVLSLLI